MRHLFSIVLLCSFLQPVFAAENVRIKIPVTSNMSDFCMKQSSICLADRPDADFYAGKEGTLVSETPFASDLGINVYAIDMDSGNRLYYFVKEGSLYSSRGLLRLDYDSRLEPESFTANGEVTFIKGITAEGEVKYKLSVGVELTETEFQLLRSTLITIPDSKQAKFVTLIQGLELIANDKGNGILVKFKTPEDSSYKEKPSLKPYMVLENKKTFLFFSLQYSGTNWVYATGASIQAGQDIVELGSLDFIREELDGVLYERYERRATREDLKALYKVVNNEGAVVRFMGSRYKSSRRVTDQHREQLKKLLDLYSLLS